MVPMPFHRKNEYKMVSRSGTSTKNEYINKAGIAKMVPTTVSRRSRFLRTVRREVAVAAGRLSVVTVDVIIVQTWKDFIPQLV
jgi:hypothetical protein